MIGFGLWDIFGLYWGYAGIMEKNMETTYNGLYRVKERRTSKQNARAVNMPISMPSGIFKRHLLASTDQETTHPLPRDPRY